MGSIIIVTHFWLRNYLFDVVESVSCLESVRGNLGESCTAENVPRMAGWELVLLFISACKWLFNGIPTLAIMIRWIPTLFNLPWRCTPLTRPSWKGGS